MAEKMQAAAPKIQKQVRYASKYMLSLGQTLEELRKSVPAKVYEDWLIDGVGMVPHFAHMVAHYYLEHQDNNIAATHVSPEALKDLMSSSQFLQNLKPLSRRLEKKEEKLKAKIQDLQSELKALKKELHNSHKAKQSDLQQNKSYVHKMLKEHAEVGIDTPVEDLPKITSRDLVELRKMLGITQQEMADKIFMGLVARETITRFESTPGYKVSDRTALMMSLLIRFRLPQVESFERAQKRVWKLKKPC